MPPNELTRMRALFQTWLPQKKASKSEILSLVGTLQHATKIVRPGRTFVSQIYSMASQLQKMHFIIRLIVTFHSDLLWWYTFLQSWNSVSIYTASCTLPCIPRFPSLHRCIRGMGLCSSIWFLMAAIPVAIRMIRHWNHGQGTNPHPLLAYLCTISIFNVIIQS